MHVKLIKLEISLWSVFIYWLLWDILRFATCDNFMPNFKVQLLTSLWELLHNA